MLYKIDHKNHIKNAPSSIFKQNLLRGVSCGCGTVGRVVVPHTRDPRFEYSHRQLLCTAERYKRDLNNNKVGNGLIFRKDVLS